MQNEGYKETERLLRALEIKISKEYRKASEEAQKKLDAYLERFKKKDELKRRALDAKLITKKEYTMWREQQIMVGEQWTKKRDELATDYHNANEIAKDMMKKAMPQIYAENRNYGMYQVEKDAGVNTSFTLYNKKAVEQLMNDNPEILPAPGKDVSRRIAAGLDVRWNRQQLQSVMLQSILLGDSIPEIAHRLAYTVGDSNHKAAIRNARTMTTGTQNAARVASMKDAQDIGVKLQQQWLAVHDGRTRHSHRAIDYEIQEVDHEFSNGCRYPGDPAGPAREVWNCRCSLRAVVEGLEPRARKYQDPLIEGMTYEEWKEAKPRSNPIDLPEKKGEAIKRSYQKEYKKYAGLDETDAVKHGKMKSGKGNSEKEGTMQLEDQRYGRNKNTLVNKTYIASGEYRNKFDKISDNPEVSRVLYAKAKEMLEHRSGTRYEDMYWIDGDTGKVIAKILDEKKEEQVSYSEKIANTIKKANNVIAMHTHPASLPPSIVDFNTAFENGYSESLVICHDGSIYRYSANEKLSETLFDMYVAQNEKKGMSIKEAQLKALNKLMENHDISVTEVI